MLAAGAACRRERVSRLLLADVFFRPQQISPPPASLSSTYNAGPTSFASARDFSAESLAKGYQTPAN